MKPRKQTILIMLFGLLLVAFAAVMAQDPQTPAQGDQKKPAEACCAMESCCCNNGSCPMKKEGETTANADTAAAKEGCCCSSDSCEMKDKDGMKNHKDACCGESCDMSKHDATMKHDPTMKHDTKGHGTKDCCKIKHKDAKDKTKKAA